MDLMAVNDVAKKRPSPKAEPTPEPDEKTRKPMILQVRGSEEFKAWFEHLARFDGLTPTALFDRSVRRYAKEVGFTEEAPPR
jgi:hypothetical protein